jgi:PKD repeat protein
MKKILALAAYLTIALTSQQSYSQITKGGSPYTISEKLPPVGATYELPEIDVAKLLEEDKNTAKGERPFRFGYTFETALNPSNSGEHILMPDGSRIWRLKIKAQNALSINITFSKYNLKAGAQVFLYNPITGESIGALDEDNNQADEKLGVGIIKGSEIVVEFYEPSGKIGDSQIEIGWITHGYKNVLGYGDSGSCNMNVNCPMGEPWEEQKRSVAIIINNGDWCTGALINNVRNDGIPYFLTANHCFANNHTTWVFYFNWESPTCQNQNVPKTQSVSGSTLISRFAPSDFMLLRLNQPPPASFNVFYAGWDRRDKAPQKSVAIHHPSGDIKKISFDEDSAISQAYSGTNDDGTHWRINNWEYNTTTEGGSSGSPLFDQNKRIVGQLHGGLASCNNNTYDKYGKIWYSWDKGTTPQARLKDWLDPDDTGVLFIDGLDASCAAISLSTDYNENFEASSNLPQRWRVSNPDNDTTWRTQTGVSAYGIGNKSAFINNEPVNTIGKSDILNTIPFNFFDKGDIKLVFDYAYIKKDLINSDSLFVRYTFDCGTIGTLVWKKGGENLNTAVGVNTGVVPNAQSWRTDTISFGNVLDRKRKVIFQFENISGAGSPIYIDNVRVLGAQVLPEPIAKFGFQINSACPGGSVQFIDSSRFNPSNWLWTFTGGTPATSTEQNPIVVYNTPGIYSATLTVTNSLGSSTTTQTAIINIRNFPIDIVPLAQNFSSTTFPPTNYQIFNPDAGRTWVRSTQTASGTAGSLFMDNFNYDSRGQLDLFYSPRVNLSSLQHFNLRFKYTYAYYQTAFSSGYDTLIIAYSTDCGQTYVPLWKKGGVELATVGNRTSRYTSTQPADWREIVLSLDTLLPKGSVSLAFISKTDYGNSLYIDDILIDSTNICPSKPTINSLQDTYCIGDTLLLATEPINGITHQWNGPGGFTFSGSTVSRAINSINLGGIYTLQNVNEYCASAKDSINIVVNPAPDMPVILQNNEVLSVNTPGAGFTLQWNVNGQPVSGANNVTFIPGQNNVLVSLTITSPEGCSITTESILYSPTALSKNSGKVASIIPNPASNHIQIKTPDNNKPRQVKLYNAIGQEILPLEYQVETQQILLSDLKNGIYMLQIIYRNGATENHKIIKQ